MPNRRGLFTILAGMYASMGIARADSIASSENKIDFHSYRFKGESLEDCTMKARRILAHHSAGKRTVIVVRAPNAVSYTSDDGTKTYVGWVNFWVSSRLESKELIGWINKDNADNPELCVDPGPLLPFGGVVNAVQDFPFLGIPDLDIGDRGI